MNISSLYRIVKGGKKVPPGSMLLSVVLLLAVAVPGASAAVSVGHSGWSWSNPLPQGNTLNAVEFVGTRGYAAGQFGTVLRTDDAGVSWSGVGTGITSDIAAIRTIGADTVLIAGGCSVRRSDDGGLSFKRLPWTPSDASCSSKVKSLSFPDSQQGYLLLENGTIFSTPTGGKSWSLKTKVPESSASDITFVSATAGVAVTRSGKIFRTTDGAGSWTQVKTGTPPLSAVYSAGSDPAVPGSNVLYAVGDSLAVIKSEDGGASWKSKDVAGVSTETDLTSIRCATASLCLLATAKGTQLLRTENGGDTFIAVTPSTDPIFAAAFVSPTRVVAVGESGSTVASDDSGINWSPVGGRVAGTFSRLRATSSSLAYAVGSNGLLAKTNNGGASCQLFGVSTSDPVVDAYFVSEFIGYAIDTSGTLLKTEDGGTTWQLINSDTSLRPASVLARTVDKVLLFGPHGVRRSTDSGGSFATVKGKAFKKTSVQNYDLGKGTIVAFGSHSLIRSIDGGAKWKKLRLPGKRALDDIDFVSANKGFALTSDGRVWQTANAGKRWRELDSVGTANGYDLAFSDAKHGYLAIQQFGADDAGYVLRTEDGGKNWTPQLVSSSSVAQLVATGGVDFALGSKKGLSSLYSTTTGGKRGTSSKLSLTTAKKKVKRGRKGTVKIRITGKLSPAEGGETVVISARAGGKSSIWKYETTRAATNGTFSTEWTIKRNTAFVARWAGDDDNAGDGSPVLRVIVK